jgi:hypothetical protein
LVRFNDNGEGRDYVMPLPPHALIMGSGVNDGLLDVNSPVEGGTPAHYKFGRAFIEYMPNRPFPLDNQQKAPSNGDAGGTVAIHFFGGV